MKLKTCKKCGDEVPAAMVNSDGICMGCEMDGATVTNNNISITDNNFNNTFFNFGTIINSEDD